MEEIQLLKDMLGVLCETPRDRPAPQPLPVFECFPAEGLETEAVDLPELGSGTDERGGNEPAPDH